MKTVEFKREVEKQEGYTVKFEDGYVQVNHKGRLVAGVGQYSESRMTVFTTVNESSDEVFDLVIEYAKTPIEDREEQKRYTVVIPDLLGNDGKQRLRYSKDTETWFVAGKLKDASVQRSFTEQELSDAPSWIEREWWEEIK